MEKMIAKGSVDGETFADLYQEDLLVERINNSLKGLSIGNGSACGQRRIRESTGLIEAFDQSYPRHLTGELPNNQGENIWNKAKR